MLTLSYAAKFELFVAHGKKNETYVKNFDRNSVNLGVNSVNYGARPQKAGIEFRAFFPFHQDARLSIFIVDVDKVEPLTIRA